MTKRSGSNTRRRAISRPVRLTAEEDQEIRKRAAECGKTEPPRVSWRVFYL